MHKHMLLLMLVACGDSVNPAAPDAPVTPPMIDAAVTPPVNPCVQTPTALSTSAAWYGSNRADLTGWIDARLEHITEGMRRTIALLG